MQKTTNALVAPRRYGRVRWLQLALLLLLPSVALAEINRAEPEPEKKVKRKYVHPCPGGTEQFGKAPPDGGKVYCRQPVVGGYRKHGNETSWYANGTKRFEGEYVRGKKHGTWTVYHRNGRKKATEVWFNGERREKVRYDKKGVAIKEVDKDAERRATRKKYRWRHSAKY